jgi:hypothetical protein
MGENIDFVKRILVTGNKLRHLLLAKIENNRS